jgi:TonB-dependent starch-binding outer membrane protein SusC
MVLRRLLFFALAAVLLGTLPLDAQGQTGTISGRVFDASTMQPLAGANVIVEGTQRGTVARSDGGFLLTAVPAGTYRVRASLVGYGTQTQDVNVTAGATATVQFALQPAAVALEGVVAIGYGTRRREEVTGSVQAVTAEEFNPGRIISPEELIQARVAGVQVINTGEPGGAVNIRIRGGTSVNASNEPLFVIDGIPLPAGGGLSAGRNPLNFLNPEDIQSMTVLKDAASTAIYGSRGANGVILIQTRTGAAGGPQFSYNTSFSTSTLGRQPDMLTAQQFRQVVQERAPDRLQFLGTADTNWRDAVLRNAQGQEHSFAVSGFGDNMNYRLSLGYLGQEGVVMGSQTERYSAAVNYNQRLFDDRLNMRATLRGARTDDQFTPGGGLGAANVMDPTQPIRLQTGEFFEHRQFALGTTNPVAELEMGTVEGTTYRAIANVEAQYRMPFMNALTGTLRLGYDVANSERRTFMPTSLWGQQRSANPGYVSRSNPRETTGVLDAFLNYLSPLGPQNSNLDLTAGYSYETGQGDYPFFEARGLSTDMLGPYGIPSANEVVPSLWVRENRLASFFGRVNYNLMDRYQFSASVRRDGSSRFGPGNQWGTFPAAAVAWRISEEPFMQGMGMLSDLRLRASWGVNGNQAIGDYLWAATYMFGDAYTQMQWGNEWVTTMRPGGFDPNIKWEETTSYNLALDYGFANNRFTGAVEYYVKDTDDLLFGVPVAAGTNLTNFITTNIGSVRNEGVEFSLNARLIDGAPGRFSWNANFNAAHNRNELVRVNRVGDGTEQIPTGGISGGVGNTIQILQPGHPVNSFFVHGADLESGPRAPFESPAPNWILALSSQFGFGGFDLGFTLRSHLGNHVYNNLASSQGFYNRLNEAGGPVNLHASVLQNQFASPRYFSAVYVEDASFTRMDNLTLGYTLAGTRRVQQVRLYGTVQNVFVITDYSGVDPEVGLSGIDNNIYPRSRTFTVGASVGF